MIRLLAAMCIRLLANAVGIILAAAILSGVSVSIASFIVAVVLFTVIEVVVDPLITKISLQYVPALRGGVALVITLIGLILTSVFTSGLHISGLSNWVLATLIVWLCALLAGLLLPLILFRKALKKRNA